MSWSSAAIFVGAVLGSGGLGSVMTHRALKRTENAKASSINVESTGALITTSENLLGVVNSYVQRLNELTTQQLEFQGRITKLETELRLALINNESLTKDRDQYHRRVSQLEQYLTDQGILIPPYPV